MLRFVCPDCKNQDHEKCRGGSWCDCLHRKPREGNDGL
jgi:hypothetical protein